jgi:hypothetical protein
MTRWAAIFDDRSDTAALRTAHTDAHLAYLETNKAEIVLAGGLRPASDNVTQ